MNTKYGNTRFGSTNRPAMRPHTHREKERVREGEGEGGSKPTPSGYTSVALDAYNLCGI